MAQRDPRIDAFIAKAQPFARPILAKRLATTLEWLAEGKTRNWKYQAKKH